MSFNNKKNLMLALIYAFSITNTFSQETSPEFHRNMQFPAVISEIPQAPVNWEQNPDKPVESGELILSHNLPRY